MLTAVIAYHHWWLIQLNGEPDTRHRPSTGASNLVPLESTIRFARIV